MEHLAEEAGPLVEVLPRALKRAVQNNKVPNDLREDILWLASRIEPYVERVKAQIAKLPEQTEKALEKADQVVENVSEVTWLHPPPSPPPPVEIGKCRKHERLERGEQEILDVQA